MDETEVCEKDGMYYLRNSLNQVFYAYEEAKECSDFPREIVTF